MHNLHVFWLNCLDALGDWFDQTGETGKAAALALEAEPDIAAWGALGSLLRPDAGRWPEAEAAFRRTMALDREDSFYPRQLGEILMDSGRLDEAETLLREAVAHRSSPMTWAALGYLLLYFRELIDEATEAYQQARDLGPADLVPASNLLAISLLLDETEPVGDADFNAVVGRHPEGGANLLRALRSLVRDDLPAAVDTFAAALTDPDGEALTLYQGFVLLILREAARRGQDNALLAALRERIIADTHWPLVAAYDAYDAYVHGEARLRDVNPEVRTAVRRIYDWARPL